MLEFKVNNYLTLKLEDNKTEIYVLDEKFIQCKFLLIEISVDEITSFENIKSIDEAAEHLDHSLENLKVQKYNIDHQTEFWAHCSNLQVWAEHSYDTRLLHRDLAFPLLKKLTDVGDPIAQKIFKEEIAKRMKEGNLNVALFLLEEGYLNYLTKEDKEIVFLDSNNRLKENIENILEKRKNVFHRIKSKISEEIARLFKKVGEQKLGKDFKKRIDIKLERGNLETVLTLLRRRLWNMVSKKEIEQFFYEENQKSLSLYRQKILREDNTLHKNALLVLKVLAESGDEIARKRSIEEFEKERERKDLSEYELLVMNETQYYKYLDRITMLKILLENGDVEAILELDELIEKRWIDFKANLSYEEEEEYYRKPNLKLRPTNILKDPHEDRENYTFMIEKRRVIDLILNSNAKFRLLEFPKPIVKLTALRKLDLYGNYISRIPGEISNIKKLQELNMIFCHTKILPQSIGELKFLEKLDLSQNDIEKLPLSFEHLKSLKILNLSNNNLTSFPQEIYKLKSLERLTISGNRIRSFHDEIENLESLKIIDIAYNKLDKLPETILNMDNLLHITIDESQKDLYPFEELKQKRKKEKRKDLYIEIY